MKTLLLFSLAFVFTISSLLAMPMDPVDGEKAPTETPLSTSRNLDLRTPSRVNASPESQDSSIQERAISSVGFNENQTSLANNLSMNTPNITECGSLGASEHDLTPASPSAAVGFFDNKKVIPLEQHLTPDRDQTLATYRAANASFGEAAQAHTAALTKAITVADKSSTSCLPSRKFPRAMKQLDQARQNLEQAEREASTAASALGYSNPESLQNRYHYSKEQITLGGATFPKSGAFTFGPELKQQLRASSTAYILERLQSPDKNFSFNGMRRDLPRAVFTIKEPKQQEQSLYDPLALPEVMNTFPREANDENNIFYLAQQSLLDRGIAKIKSFIGENLSLQIAITSFMYQRGAADLQIIKYQASRGVSASGEKLAPFFSDGLDNVEKIMHITIPLKGAKRNETLRYALDKELLDDSSVAPCQKFKLTIIYSCENERVDKTSRQEFMCHQGASLVYVFEENSLFNSEQPFSLENLPVTLYCTEGLFSHVITPYERPLLKLDPVTSDIFHRLEPAQQATVTAYQNAQQEYKAAEATYQQRINQIASRSSVLQAPGLATSEKGKAERTLQAAQNKLTRATQAMRSSTTTARFLEENTGDYSQDKISFQRDDQTVTFPADGCFVGGKKLQQEVTEETALELGTCFNNAQENPYTSLQADLENPNYSFVLQASEQEPVSLSEATGIQQLQEFVNDPQTARAIGTIMNKDALVVEMQIINNMPRYHDAIEEQADGPPYSSEKLQGPNNGDLIREGSVPSDHATFTLEKRIPSENEDQDSADNAAPYFVLTITHQLEQHLPADAENKHGTVHYNRTARFIYMFKKNDDFDFGELLTLQNLPVDVRCTGIRIDHTLEHGF